MDTRHPISPRRRTARPRARSARANARSSANGTFGTSAPFATCTNPRRGRQRVGQDPLRTRGDSVFGYWQAPSSPGDQPPEPSSIRGTIRGDSVHVQVDPPAPDGLLAEWGHDIVQFLKTYVHDMPPMTTYLDFVARGDRSSARDAPQPPTAPGKSCHGRSPRRARESHSTLAT